ncbi:hypothetical protein LZ190_09735, partial [Rhodovulum sulfidophilum]|nr:hypothetical protein [Rhodovulum sulfidophilum]
MEVVSPYSPKALGQLEVGELYLFDYEGITCISVFLGAPDGVFFDHGILTENGEKKFLIRYSSEPAQQCFSLGCAWCLNVPLSPGLLISNGRR